MDPKILQMFRLLFGIDEKLLPDSMTPDEFGKFIQDQKGKLFGNPEDFKGLQKIISAKDIDLKKLTDEAKKLSEKKIKSNPKDSKLKKLFEKQAKQLDEVVKELAKRNLADETKQLKKDYPDILPDLLIGKDPEKVTEIVGKQRKLNEKLYGDAKHFTQPKYNDIEEIQKRIDEIKADPNISGEKAAVEVMNLEREKENFKPTPED